MGNLVLYMQWSFGKKHGHSALFFRDGGDCSREVKGKKTTGIHFLLDIITHLSKVPSPVLSTSLQNGGNRDKANTRGRAYAEREASMGSRMKAKGDFYCPFTKILPSAVLLLFLTSLSCSCPKVSFFHL